MNPNLKLCKADFQVAQDFDSDGHLYWILSSGLQETDYLACPRETLDLLKA